jgi:hypothetical protein
VEDLHPTAGVRVALTLAETNDTGARYDAAIYTPAARFDYRVTVALPDGKLDIVAAQQSEPGATPAQIDVLRAIARTVVKDGLAASPPVWPRRVVRWRDK